MIVVPLREVMIAGMMIASSIVVEWMSESFR
jgi:hypothetical protein